MTSRIPPLPKERTDADTAALLKRTGMAFNVHRVMANAPSLLEGYLGLSQSLDRGVLPKRIREQVALAIAARNGCDYCLAAHRAGGRFAKLSAAEIELAERGVAAERREAAALRLALEMLERVGDVDDANFEPARAAGLGDTEILELAGHVALNMLTNIVNRLARTPNDFATTKMKVATEVLSRLGIGG